jgi:hypothetical protein
VTGLLQHKSSSGIFLLLFWWQRDQPVQKVMTAQQQSRSLGKLSFCFFRHKLMLQLDFFLMNARVKMKMASNTREYKLKKHKMRVGVDTQHYVCKFVYFKCIHFVCVSLMPMVGVAFCHALDTIPSVIVQFPARTM